MEMKGTRIFYENYGTRKPIVVNIGGSRSSKSYSLAQLYIAKFFNEPRKKFLTTRKTFPSLRSTIYKQILDLMKEYGLYKFLDHSIQANTLVNPFNGSYWLFSSLDDPEKIKSAEFNYIHMEEANEFTWDDYMILKLRLSGPTIDGNPNQIHLTFNPSDEEGWIRKELITRDEVELIHSTYKDNPFLSREYIHMLEGLKEQDEMYWNIYGLGLWGVPTDLVYAKIHECDEMPKNPDAQCYGLDFGFNNPSVVLDIALKDEELYFDQIIYQERLTNPELIDLMKEKIIPYNRTRPMYADSAEPARIKEIKDAGFKNCKGGEKNVKDGIDFMRARKKHITKRSVETIRDFKRYKNKKNKDGTTSDEPLKFMDHGPDAGRYGAYSHFRKMVQAIITATKQDFY